MFQWISFNLYYFLHNPRFFGQYLPSPDDTFFPQYLIVIRQSILVGSLQLLAGYSLQALVFTFIKSSRQDTTADDRKVERTNLKVYIKPCASRQREKEIQFIAVMSDFLRRFLRAFAGEMST